MKKVELSELVGKNIVSLRKKLGITQKTLSELLDITQDSMMRIEKGQIAPKMTRIQEIADILQCPVSYLFYTHNNAEVDELASILAERIKGLVSEDKEYLMHLVNTTVLHLKTIRNECTS